MNPNVRTLPDLMSDQQRLTVQRTREILRDGLYRTIGKPDYEQIGVPRRRILARLCKKEQLRVIFAESRNFHRGRHFLELHRTAGIVDAYQPGGGIRSQVRGV